MKVFYAVRIFLGFLSVMADSALVVAVSRTYGKRLAAYTLAMLCLASGCFFSSTSKYVFLINCYLICALLIYNSLVMHFLCDHEDKLVVLSSTFLFYK